MLLLLKDKLDVTNFPGACSVTRDSNTESLEAWAITVGDLLRHLVIQKLVSYNVTFLPPQILSFALTF